ncbi:MAG: hypothetical protein QOF00_4494 [Pseudonocardiales bacterium]|nr:hypothetical protein [Pseudonocardiales bacterium]
MSRQARLWLALNALVVIVALAIQIPITAADTTGVFATPASRVANLFTFFTIMSNLLVAGVCIALVARPALRSTTLAVLWLDALLGITVSGIVYNTVLIGLYDLHGGALVADRMFHQVSPVMFVIGWLLLGPRGLVSLRTVLLSLIYPLAWLAFTLVRGAIITWYPYPFLEVTDLGYGRVALNSLVITLIFLALAAGIHGLDRVLGRSSRALPQLH